MKERYFNAGAAADDLSTPPRKSETVEPAQAEKGFWQKLSQEQKQKGPASPRRLYAREVKTERFSRTEGKTPAFVEGEVQRLLDAVDVSSHTGLRDRALLGVLAYTFSRIGAVVNLKVEDYYPSGKRFLLRFKEKGGKEKELPVHHKLEELLDQYLKATCLEKEPGSPLFPASIGKTGKLSRRQLVRTDAADMLKRRLKQAGLPAHHETL